MTSYTGLQVAQIHVYCVQHEDKDTATVRLKRGNGSIKFHNTRTVVHDTGQFWFVELPLAKNAI